MTEVAPEPHLTIVAVAARLAALEGVGGPAIGRQDPRVAHLTFFGTRALSKGREVSFPRHATGRQEEEGDGALTDGHPCPSGQHGPARPRWTRLGGVDQKPGEERDRSRRVRQAKAVPTKPCAALDLPAGARVSGPPRTVNLRQRGKLRALDLADWHPDPLIDHRHHRERFRRGGDRPDRRRERRAGLDRLSSPEAVAAGRGEHAAALKVVVMNGALVTADPEDRPLAAAPAGGDVLTGSHDTSRDAGPVGTATTAGGAGRPPGDRRGQIDHR